MSLSSHFLWRDKPKITFFDKNAQKQGFIARRNQFSRWGKWILSFSSQICLSEHYIFITINLFESLLIHSHVVEDFWRKSMQYKDGYERKKKLVDTNGRMKTKIMTIAFIYTEEKFWNFEKILVFRQKHGPKLLFEAQDFLRLDQNWPR